MNDNKKQILKVHKNHRRNGLKISHIELLCMNINIAHVGGEVLNRLASTDSMGNFCGPLIQLHFLFHIRNL